MTQKKQIIINGASGRMGREIIQLLEEHPHAEFRAEGGFGKSSPKKALDKKWPKNGIVAIDFSSPEGMRSALSLCVQKKIPFVSGTTGLSQKDCTALKSASLSLPVLWAPNMSIGVNLFLNIIECLGQTLKDFDLQIEEYHHSKKKDSPSGTAKLLQEAVEKTARTKLPPILSGRGGGIVGIHKLWLMAEEETLTIEHTALSRSVFARGSIEAALWISNKKPGLYTMRDFLND